MRISSSILKTSTLLSVKEVSNALRSKSRSLRMEVQDWLLHFEKQVGSAVVRQ